MIPAYLTTYNPQIPHLLLIFSPYCAKLSSMTANLRNLAIILLAFWLPLQSLAGALAHCERVADPVSAVEMSTDSAGPAEPDCHGSAALPSSASAGEHQTDAENRSCYHCDGNCHGAKNLSLLSDHHFADTPINGDFLNLHQSAFAGYPRSPQRPPCTINFA